MLIGVPKEIKSHEYRVGLTPESASELIAQGHDVFVETKAGIGIGADDAAYEAAGVNVLQTAAEIFAKSDMIVKVKEPQPIETAMLRQGQTLFTYLHLAPDPVQTKALVSSGATCIAYETVTADNGSLPLLKPMSQVAGRMSIQAGATALEKAHGGRGVLLGGVPGVAPGRVIILGAGVVGFNAAQMAVGLGADVTILDRNADVLEATAKHFGNSAKTAFSTRTRLLELLETADLVVGAVLIPGAAAPKLVRKEDLAVMRKGAVLVDVAIDQGGCFETSRATTHDNPTYEVDGIIHYCVANMPGAVARTSTYALNNVTLPFVLQIANKGWKDALRDNAHLLEGLNVWDGHITNEPVARALGYEYVPACDAIEEHTLAVAV